MRETLSILITVLIVLAMWLQVRYVVGLRRSDVAIPPMMLVVRAVNIALLAIALALVVGFVWLQKG